MRQFQSCSNEVVYWRFSGCKIVCKQSYELSASACYCTELGVELIAGWKLRILASFLVLKCSIFPIGTNLMCLSLLLLLQCLPKSLVKCWGSKSGYTYRMFLPHLGSNRLWVWQLDLSLKQVVGKYFAFGCGVCMINLLNRCKPFLDSKIS